MVPTYVDVYYCFLGYYKKCDGIILPEHTDSSFKRKANSNRNSSADTCNGVKLSSFNYNTQDLSHSNHVELKKNALLMHLESLHAILSGVTVMEDAVDCIESVCSTFLSLHKNYLCYKATRYANQVTDHQWILNDIEMVCVVQT